MERAKPPVALPPDGLAPTARGERLDVVDVVRGFALIGIAAVNVAPGSMPVYGLVAGLELWTSLPDRAAEWLIRLAAEGKFYPLFSFLFGFGFALQLERADARGARFAVLYARRLLALLLIGLIHAVFIWYGDILVQYALLGFVLLLYFRRRRERTLLTWAAIFLAIPILLNVALLVLVEVSRQSPDGAAAMERSFAESAAAYRSLAEEATRSYRDGSWAEIQAQRLSDLRFVYSTMLFFLPNVLAMFLVGVYAARRRILHDVPTHRRFIRAVAIWGGVVGLVGSVAYVLSLELASRAEPSILSVLGSVGYGIGGPVLGLAYAALLTLAYTRSADVRRRLAPLAAAGRMALTNYLLQSVIATSVLYGYGLGLYGTMGPAAGLLLVAAIVALELWLSSWWLARFRFGPVEWLWRSLAYASWQPLRLAPRAAPD